MITIRIGPEPFDAGAELAALAAGDEVGGVASFVGHVRGGEVTALTLQHYPGMTERAMGALAQDAAARWGLAGVTLVHRVGRLLPGDAIVFVGTASRHRAAALQGCAALIDALKSGAPFWKWEERADGAAWVDGG